MLDKIKKMFSRKKNQEKTKDTDVFEIHRKHIRHLIFKENLSILKGFKNGNRYERTAYDSFKKEYKDEFRLSIIKGIDSSWLKKELTDISNSEKGKYKAKKPKWIY